jgi:septation ring formation regulator EzrA
MNHVSASPFDSIENAHDFVRLFSEAVNEARKDVDTDIQREMGSNSSRRLVAFRLAAYNLEKLEQHLSKSRRILNDLRSLRRLLFEERAKAREAAKPVKEELAQVQSRKSEMPRPLLPALPAVSAAQKLPTAPGPRVVA